MTAELPRILLSAAIVVYFGWAMMSHWSNGLEETLQNAMMIAVGYWLGSSRGSADKARQIEAMATPPATGDDPDAR